MLRRRVLLKAGQAVDVNTLMLLHFDGDLTGISTIGDVVNVNSGFDFADKKFGSASVYNSDFTTGPAFVFPSYFIYNLLSDFTIDFWVKPWQSLPDNASTRIFELGTNSSGTRYPWIYLYMGKYNGEAYVEVVMYNNANAMTAYRYKYIGSYPNTWCHMALVRRQNKLYLYFNGQLAYTPGDDIPDITTEPDIDQTICSALYNSGSKIDEFRFSNIARWTENFTPPTAPY